MPWLAGFAGPWKKYEISCFCKLFFMCIMVEKSHSSSHTKASGCYL